MPDGGNDTFDNDFLTWLEGRELGLPVSDIKSRTVDSDITLRFQMKMEIIW